MRYYGISKVGQYHLDKGSDVCQDYFDIAEISDGVMVVAVADGVGSEEHSEYASEAASKACVQYCKEYYSKIEDKKQLLTNSFYSALFAVQDVSMEKGIPTDQLHCTLCAAIITNDSVYVCNVGDSGAIGLDSSGRYVLLTKQQNDEDGCVAPLCDEKSWMSQEYKGQYSGVLLATDGFYNYMFPPYLSKDEETYDYEKKADNIDYIRMSEYIDRHVLGDEMSNEELNKVIEEKIESIPKKASFDGIIDDITVVGVMTDNDHLINDQYNEQIDRESLIESYLKKVNAVLYDRPKDAECTDDEKAEEKNGEGTATEESDRIGEGRRYYLGTDSSRKELLLDTSKIRESDSVSRTFIVDDRTVARIYNSDSVKDNDGFEGKITRIAAVELTVQLKNVIEMPTELIHDDDGVCGYLANNIGESETMDCYLCGVAEKPVQHRAAIAGNLAIITSMFHENGIHNIIGDYNSIRISDNDTIALANLDIDEVAITDGDKAKDDDRCDVNDDRTVTALVFRLLFNGTEPLIDGKYIFDGDSDDPKDRAGIPDIALFPQYLGDMFRNAFSGKGGCPTSRQWVEAISRYATEVRRCSDDPRHIYYQKAEGCPYCSASGRKNEGEREE